jgi:hypothetical protein
VKPVLPHHEGREFAQLDRLSYAASGSPKPVIVQLISIDAVPLKPAARYRVQRAASTQYHSDKMEGFAKKADLSKLTIGNQ